MRGQTGVGPQADVYAAFSRAEDAEERVLARLLARADFRSRRVLEIGVGAARYTAALASHAARYVAIDVSPELLALARRRLAGTKVELVEADMLAIPLRDASVERIFASWSFPAYGAAEESLAEAFRVLGPHGEIWLVGNAPDGDFMEMRGEAEMRREAAGQAWYLNHRFSIAATVDTEFVFPSLAEAGRVLVAIFGPKAEAWLSRHPSRRLARRVNIYVARRPDKADGDRGRTRVASTL